MPILFLTCIRKTLVLSCLDFRNLGLSVNFGFSAKWVKSGFRLPVSIDLSHFWFLQKLCLLYRMNLQCFTYKNCILYCSNYNTLYS